MHRQFGDKVLRDGSRATSFIITDRETNTTAEILNYGATLYALFVWLGRERLSEFRERRDVVLAFKSLRDYARQLRDQKSITESLLWDVEDREENTITLRHNASRVIYTVAANELSVDYEWDEMTPEGGDEAAYDNPARRILFNLKGHGVGTIEDHDLLIAAERFIDHDHIMRSVDGTPVDFRRAKPIGERIHIGSEGLARDGGYDHIYISGSRRESLLNDGTFSMAHSDINGPYDKRCRALLTDHRRTARMRVFTDSDALFFSSGNRLGGELGKGGCVYQRRGGLVLAPVHYDIGTDDVTQGTPGGSIHTVYKFD